MNRVRLLSGMLLLAGTAVAGNLVGDDWRREFPREEVAPKFEALKTGLRLAGRGNPGTFGYWVTSVKGLAGAQAAPKGHPLTLYDADFLSSRYYRFRCAFQVKNVTSLSRSIVMRIRWRDAKGEEMFGEYISRYHRDGEWYRADQVLAAPKAASGADIELVLRWTAEGEALWRDISFEETPAPQHRKIKVATVSFEPPSPSTPEKNRQFYGEKLEAAAAAGAGIVCLGEGITVVSTGMKYADVAEPVPGPTSRWLGEIARAHKMYIVAGIYERAGNLIYNTALLIDRHGEVVGKYRKTHLPVNETNGGIMPGTEYPVFQTDFGTIGIEICYDNFFPEVARSLAVQGAEIVFLPIWGDLRGNGQSFEVVARSRAIDNGVHFVAANYSNKRAFVIDPEGRILADTGGRSGMAVAEIDLDFRSFGRWMWFDAYGDWKGQYPLERRTETYAPLAVERNGSGQNPQER